VLHYLYHTGGQAPQGEVTAHLRVKPSTANGILDRMEEKELVERSVSEADARRRWITLTEKGKALQECCRQVFLETEALMVRGLSEAEQEQLFANTARAMGDAELFIKQRHVRNCYRADPRYGEGVARALGIKLEDALKENK
jgi:DNA-binding MarR family transcriptional regulator